MCVLYVRCWYKVRPRTLGCDAMGRAVLLILRSRLLLYSATVWSEQSASCFVLSRQKLYVCMVVYVSWLHSCLCV